MNDILNIVVDGDILRTFVNMFTVIIALDLFASVCAIFAKIGSGVSE